MQILDNVNKTVKDDLEATISKGDKISIAAACFSIYAYEALKKQLNGIEELRFVFTSPTFLKEKAPRQQREFYIPQLNRERSLYGTEFEVKLRNELTQKAIARECADWIRKKVKFRSNVTGGTIGNFLTVVKPSDSIAYSPINSFTTSDLGCERGNNIMNLVNRIDAPLANEYVKMFEQIWNDKNLLQDVTNQVIEGITAAYNENSPEFIYIVAIYNIFNEFLSDISEDVFPNEATGFKETKIWGMLYDFQKDAVLAITNKLEKYNGCILADSVGLGKTCTKTKKMDRAQGSFAEYDLIGKIAEGTTLTRRTTTAILSGISREKLWLFRENPEEFIFKVSGIINRQKASVVVEHITYTPSAEEPYSQDIFNMSRTSNEYAKAFEAKNAIQDYIFTDGTAANSVERRFAEDLDTADEVIVYAKLPRGPRGFYIPTPVGNYSPDWAITFKKGTVKHIFFIAETKGSMNKIWRDYSH